MKTKIQFFTIALAFLFFAACQGEGEQKSSKEETKEEVPENRKAQKSEFTATYELDVENSNIEWTGSKKFVKFAHKGTLRFKSGTINVKNGQIKDATFVVDMNTIDNTDLKGKDGYDKLVGHLKSEDFFYVEEFPESTFELNKIEENSSADFSHTAKGVLTIRGISKQTSFPVNIEFDDSKFNAIGTLNFNRTNFDVKYGSTDFFEVVKDKAISNEIQLTLHVEGRTKAM